MREKCRAGFAEIGPQGDTGDRRGAQPGRSKVLGVLAGVRRGRRGVDKCAESFQSCSPLTDRTNSFLRTVEGRPAGLVLALAAGRCGTPIFIYTSKSNTL